MRCGIAKDTQEQVALLTEGVGRNKKAIVGYLNTIQVALLTEGVGRNGSQGA